MKLKQSGTKLIMLNVKNKMKKQLKNILIIYIYIILFSFILSISFSFIGFCIGFIQELNLANGLELAIKTFIASFDISFVGLAIIIGMNSFNKLWRN